MNSHKATLTQPFYNSTIREDYFNKPTNEEEARQSTITRMQEMIGNEEKVIETIGKKNKEK